MKQCMDRRRACSLPFVHLRCAAGEGCRGAERLGVEKMVVSGHVELIGGRELLQAGIDQTSL